MNAARTTATVAGTGFQSRIAQIGSFGERLIGALDASWFDVAAIVVLTCGGFGYHRAVDYWTIGNVGEAPYGDAQFWWDGALHVSEGIFQDSPGQGFRPGYFWLTGLALPVLGTHFFTYHKFFLVVFLAACAFFYLALRRPLGRLAAFCGVGALIFNPFTAEWASTSTSDATGLLLHVVALGCLLIGVEAERSRGWLIAFGAVFALGTLTRPLVTPFIGLVVVALAIWPQGTLRRRLTSAAYAIAAFCVPIFGWMGIQKAVIGEWSISSNDASAFYAASDPQIQVWTPAMYERISKLAAERYGTPSPDGAMLNAVFRRETIDNYLVHWKYHVARVIPHFSTIASFSPKSATHGTRFWQLLFTGGLAVALSLQLAVRRRWLGVALLAASASCVVFSRSSMTYLTLLGAAAGIWTASRSARLPLLLLGGYWLTGVAALMLVGGTWGPPLGPLTDLNALGYRLGLQVFFAGDLAVICCLASLAGRCLKTELVTIRCATVEAERSGAWTDRLMRPQMLPGAIITIALALVVAAAATTYSAGSVGVARRWYARNHVAPIHFPDARETIRVCKGRPSGPTPRIARDYASLTAALSLKSPVRTDSGEVAFTGGVSPFVWSLAGQERTQLLIYQQDYARPFGMGVKHMFFEAPQTLRAHEWSGRQGIFIVRNFADEQNKSNLPYYLTVPALRGFIPLADDGRRFASENAIWFPAVKNATQLDASRELTCRGGRITWALDSGTEKFMRRFQVVPEKFGGDGGTATLIVDMRGARGERKLRFAYAWGEVPGKPRPTGDDVEIIVSAVEAESSSRRVLQHDVRPIPGPTETLAPTHIACDALNAGVDAVEIECKKLPADSGIWFYEFNLTADDFSSAETEGLAMESERAQGKRSVNDRPADRDAGTTRR